MPTLTQSSCPGHDAEGAWKPEWEKCPGPSAMSATVRTGAGSRQDTYLPSLTKASLRLLPAQAI